MTITVKELIDDDRLENIHVVTDEQTLQRQMSTVTVLDAPDGPSWLKGNEFILTSGYIFKNEAELLSFTTYLIKMKACGMGIKLNRYHNQISEELIALANQHAFSIVIIPYDYVWSDLISIYYSLRGQETTVLKEITSNNIYDLFVAAKWGTLQFAKKIVEILDCSIIVFDHNATLLYENMTDPDLPLTPFLQTELTENTIQRVGEYFYLLRKGFEKKSDRYFIIGSRNQAQLSNILEVINMLMKFQRYDNFGNDSQERYDFFLSKLIGQKLTYDELVEFQGEQKIDHGIYTSILIFHNSQHQLMYNELKDKLQPLLSNKTLKLNSLVQSYEEQEKLLVLVEFKSGEPLLMTDIFAAIRKVAIKYKKRPQDLVVIGEFYPSLMDIQVSFGEASRALSISQTIFSNEPFVSYDQVILFDHTLLNDAYRINFFELDRLEVDKDKDNYDKLVTLEVYLEERNYKRAADRLFLHENTLRYRINKISELLQIDFDNSFYASSLLNKIKIWRLFN